MQGPLLLSQFCGCLVQGSACAYCGASIIFAFREAGEGEEEAHSGMVAGRVLYSCTFLVAGVLMGLRIFYSCRMGQRIEDELFRCR